MRDLARKLVSLVRQVRGRKALLVDDVIIINEADQEGYWDSVSPWHRGAYVFCEDDDIFKLQHDEVFR